MNIASVSLDFTSRTDTTVFFMPGVTMASVSMGPERVCVVSLPAWVYWSCRASGGE